MLRLLALKYGNKQIRGFPLGSTDQHGYKSDDTASSTFSAGRNFKCQRLGIHLDCGRGVLQAVPKPSPVSGAR